MLYYPSSQIKPNLYTNGGEYILSSTKEDYKGFYYKTSKGTKYTGKNPQNKLNILLIEKTTLNTQKIENDFNILTGLESPNLITTINYRDTSTYLNLSTNLITSERFIPLFNTTSPTQKDLNLGQFNRYFCKKTNELKYLEIDKETYDQLKAKDPKIAWDLYEPASILWITSGDQEDTFNTNKLSVFKIEQNQRWYGFSQYFKEDYLKYYSFEDDSL